MYYIIVSYILRSIDDYIYSRRKRIKIFYVLYCLYVGAREDFLAMLYPGSLYLLLLK